MSNIPANIGRNARIFSVLAGYPARETASLRDLAQFLGLAQALELFEALVLDLADPLAGDVEGATDLVQRAGVLAPEAGAQLQDATLAVGEVLQRFLQRLFGQQVRG